jgi:hypothetical protein
LPSIKTPPQRLTCAAAVAVFAALVNLLKAASHLLLGNPKLIDQIQIDAASRVVRQPDTFR